VHGCMKELSRCPIGEALFVIARNSSFTYKGRAIENPGNGPPLPSLDPTETFRNAASAARVYRRCHGRYMIEP
jgi:hypothetical protein